MQKNIKSIQDGLRSVSNLEVSPTKKKEILKALENAHAENDFYAMGSKPGFFTRFFRQIKQVTSVMAALVIVATGVIYFNSIPNYELHLGNAQSALGELQNLALIEEANANLDTKSVQLLIQEINQETREAIEATESIRDPEKLKAALKEIQTLQRENILALNQVGSNLDEQVLDQALADSYETLEEVTQNLNEVEKSTEGEGGFADLEKKEFETSELNLTIAPNYTTPSIIKKGEENIPTFMLILEAEENTNLESIAFQYEGEGHENWHSMTLLQYRTQVEYNKTIEADGRIEFTFDTPLKIPKGFSTLELKGSVDEGIEEGTLHYFSIDWEGSLSSDSSTTGEFPIKGDSLTVDADPKESEDDLTLLMPVELEHNGPINNFIDSGDRDVDLLNFLATSKADTTIAGITSYFIILDNKDNSPSFDNASYHANSISSTGNVNEYNVFTSENASLLTPGDMIKVGQQYARVISNKGQTQDGGLIIHSSSKLDSLSNILITEVNAYDYLTNVRIINNNDQSIFFGPLGKASDAQRDDKVYKLEDFGDYQFSKDKIENLSLVSNVEKELVSGYKVYVTFRFLEANGEKYEYGLYGNRMTIKNPPNSGGISAENESQIIHDKGETVRIDAHPVICDEWGESCEDVIVALEVDLTQPSNGSELTGKFYVRGFLNGKKIGEIQITRNYNPFNGDGGTPIVEDEDRVLTLKSPFMDNFYLKYYDSMSHWSKISTNPGYELILRNLEEPSSFNGRWIDFSYQDDVLSISFPQ